jgi:hypothetical protein
MSDSKTFTQSDLAWFTREHWYRHGLVRNVVFTVQA